MEIRCGNPSCAASLDAPDLDRAGPRRIEAFLKALGWRFKREDGKVRPWCPRCSW